MVSPATSENSLAVYVGIVAIKSALFRVVQNGDDPGKVADGGDRLALIALSLKDFINETTLRVVGDAEMPEFA